MCREPDLILLLSDVDGKSSDQFVGKKLVVKRGKSGICYI